MCGRREKVNSLEEERKQQSLGRMMMRWWQSIMTQPKPHDAFRRSRRSPRWMVLILTIMSLFALFSKDCGVVLVSGSTTTTRFEKSSSMRQHQERQEQQQLLPSTSTSSITVIQTNIELALAGATTGTAAAGPALAASSRARQAWKAAATTTTTTTTAQTTTSSSSSTFDDSDRSMGVRGHLPQNIIFQTSSSSSSSDAAATSRSSDPFQSGFSSPKQQQPRQQQPQQLNSQPQKLKPRYYLQYELDKEQGQQQQQQQTLRHHSSSSKTSRRRERLDGNNHGDTNKIIASSRKLKSSPTVAAPRKPSMASMGMKPKNSTKTTETGTCNTTHTNALLDALRDNIREAQACAAMANTLSNYITNTSIPSLQYLVQSFSTPNAVLSAARAQQLLDAVQSQLLLGTSLQVLPIPIEDLIENVLTNGMVDLTSYWLAVDEASTDAAAYGAIFAGWNITLAQLKVISTTATNLAAFPTATLTALLQAVKAVELNKCRTRDVTALETASQAYLTEYQDILTTAFEPCNTALQQSPVVLQTVPRPPASNNQGPSSVDEMFSEVTLYYQDLVDWVTNYTNSVVAAIQQAQADGSIHCCLSTNQLDYAALASTLSEFETIKACFLEGPIDLTTAADVIPLFDNAQTWLDIVSATISNINAVSQSIRSAVLWTKGSSSTNFSLLPDFAKSYPQAQYNSKQSPYFFYTSGIPLVWDTAAVLDVNVPPFAATLSSSFNAATTTTLAKESGVVVYSTCVEGANVYDSGVYQNYWEQESFDCCSATGICNAQDPITLYDGLGCSGNFVGTLSLPVAPAITTSVDVKKSTCVRPTTKSIQFRGPLAPGFLLEVHSAVPPPCGSNYLAFKLLRPLNSGESFCLATLEESATALLYATVYLPFDDNSSNGIHLNGNAFDFSVTVNTDTDPITTVCLSSQEKTLPAIPVDSFKDAATYGDPHVITFGGLSFSCQATGEFILTKSLDSLLQVQVRYEKITEALSVGRAVVVKDSAEESPVVQISQPDDLAGGDPVSFAYNGCPLQLYVNGVLRKNPKFLGTANVTVSALSQDSLRILYPSGLTVIVTVSNVENNDASSCFLSSQFVLPLATVGSERLIGLFGIPTATTPTDWTDRNGQLLPVPDPPDTFFEAGYYYCVDNWCMHNASDSLFVYSPGKSFQTYFGCDIPYTGIDLSTVSDSIREACGENIACLVDGSGLGLQGALDTLRQESIIQAASAEGFECTLCGTGTFIAGTTILPGTNLTCNQASDQVRLALTAAQCQTLVDQAASSCCFVPADGGIPQSQSPSSMPSSSISPSAIPSVSKSPSVFPSRRPSVFPSVLPSKSPLAFPSIFPTRSLPPSSRPSDMPSSVPSTVPTYGPSRPPTSAPSSKPSDVPSSVPSKVPSYDPSRPPTSAPPELSDAPSSVPSLAPTDLPTIAPSPKESDAPSSVPSLAPSDFPSRLPTIAPSPKESDAPSSVPSLAPSDVPSRLPTIAPSPKQSDVPSTVPSEVPSRLPTIAPSIKQSDSPSSVPSFTLSDVPSRLPTIAPSLEQSDVPSTVPSDAPSRLPTIAPSIQLSDVPSFVPSKVPSRLLTIAPSIKQSDKPSSVPSDIPSQLPTIAPSPKQTDAPHSVPSIVPSDFPSRLPTIAPSIKKSDMPSSVPSEVPSK